MALDFRDSFFQDDPFRFLSAESAETDLFVQTHGVWFGERVKGINLLACANNNETLVEEYRTCLADKALINAGGFIGKGHVFEQLESIVVGMAKEGGMAEGCDDQMATNIGVHCNLLSSPTSVKVFKQGMGPIHTLGYGSQFLKLGTKVGNLDCFPSPVVYQGNAVNFSAPAPLEDCRTGDYEKQDLPGGGYTLVPVKQPQQSTGESPFQPAEKVLS